MINSGKTNPLLNTGYFVLISLTSLAIINFSTADKLVIKSHNSGNCIHVSGKTVSVLPCVWKPHNSTNNPYRLTHELLTIQPYEFEEVEGSSSEESNLSGSPFGNQSYYFIRVKQTTCLMALDDELTAGRCRSKRARFLIRKESGSSFKFTIETPTGRCLTWNGEDPELFQTFCHLRGLQKLWIFCKEQGECGVDPSHPTLTPLKPHKVMTTTVPTTTTTIATTTTSQTLAPAVVPVSTTMTSAVHKETGGDSSATASSIANELTAVLQLFENDKISPTTKRNDVHPEASSKAAVLTSFNGMWIALVFSFVTFQISS